MAENKDMPSDMIRFLYEWLVNHIIFCDKKYVPYLASHDSDNSCEKETTTALNNFNQEQWNDYNIPESVLYSQTVLPRQTSAYIKLFEPNFDIDSCVALFKME